MFDRVLLTPLVDNGQIFKNVLVSKLCIKDIPADKYMFKVNNRNMYEKGVKYVQS